MEGNSHISKCQKVFHVSHCHGMSGRMVFHGCENAHYLEVVGSKILLHESECFLTLH